MKKIIIAIVVYLVFQKLAIAQISDLGSWNILNFKYNQTEKLSYFGEAQIRSLQFYNHFHYYEIKGGLNYKTHKNLKLSLAMGSYQTYKEGGNFKLPKNNNEFRIWPQVILSHSINNFKIEQRYRAEMRFTSNGYRNRFRYRLGITYPFGKETNGYKPWQAGVSNELFFTDNEPYFERNRFQVNMNYKTSKNTTFQLGYLQQFDYKLNDEIGRGFLVLGFYIELFKKTNKEKPEIQGNEN